MIACIIADKIDDFIPSRGDITNLIRIDEDFKEDFEDSQKRGISTPVEYQFRRIFG